MFSQCLLTNVQCLVNCSILQYLYIRNSVLPAITGIGVSNAAEIEYQFRISICIFLSLSMGCSIVPFQFLNC